MVLEISNETIDKVMLNTFVNSEDNDALLQEVLRYIPMGCKIVIIDGLSGKIIYQGLMMNLYKYYDHSHKLSIIFSEDEHLIIGVYPKIRLDHMIK